MSYYFCAYLIQMQVFCFDGSWHADASAQTPLFFGVQGEFLNFCLNTVESCGKVFIRNF